MNIPSHHPLCHYPAHSQVLSTRLPKSRMTSTNKQTALKSQPSQRLPRQLPLRRRQFKSQRHRLPQRHLSIARPYLTVRTSLYPLLIEVCADIERASNDPGRPSTNPTYHNSRMGCCRRHFDAHRSCLHPSRHQKSMD